MITETPLIVYACLFLVTLALGFWLGVQVSTERVRRFKTRAEMAKMLPR